MANLAQPSSTPAGANPPPREDDHPVEASANLAPASAGAKAQHWFARFGVIGLVTGAAAAYVASFFLPWWRFKLYAPQYPGGLTLIISLTGMGGDVKEIDTLNHYIGMAKMADAAPMERMLAGYGVGFLAFAVLALALVLGKRLNALLLVPGLAFPAVFIGDSFYWLYRFGHSMDPKAPINLPPFTPEMFGNGKIGQFLTFAQPGPGFWLALVALALLAVAAGVRRSVCAGCARRADCGTFCPSGFIGPRSGLPKEHP